MPMNKTDAICVIGWELLALNCLADVASLMVGVTLKVPSPSEKDRKIS